MVGLSSTLSQAVYNSDSVFTFYFCRPSRSAVSENLQPSHLFFSNTHTALHMHEASEFPRYNGAFQSSNGHLMPQLFLLEFFITLLFAPSVIPTQATIKLKHLSVIVSSKKLPAPWGEGFDHWLCTNQPWKWDLPVNYPTGQVIIILRKWVFERPPGQSLSQW